MANYTDALLAYQAIAPIIDRFKVLGDALHEISSLDNEIAEKTAAVTSIRAQLAGLQGEAAAARDGLAKRTSDVLAEAATARSLADAHVAAQAEAGRSMIESAKARAGELEAFTLRHVATLKDEAEAEVARLKAAAEAELHSIGERVRTARDHLAKLTNI